MANKKYVPVVQPKAVSEYTPGTYKSQYGNQLNSALNTVTNWKYDPLKDANYQALAKVYGARGNIAAQDTLGDAASLNGGMQTSYAVSAAQQARNQYNQELAALVPDLEANAYNKAQATYAALRDADDTAYGRYRDTESDRQFAYTNAYNAYRDQMADYQWGQNYNYQLDRDAVADDQWAKNYAYQTSRDAVADAQWLKNFNYQVSRDKVADAQWAKEYALSAGKVSGSGGGGKKKKRKGRKSGGGGYTSTPSNSNSNNLDALIEAANAKLNSSSKSKRNPMDKMSNADLKRNGGKETLKKSSSKKSKKK